MSTSDRLKSSLNCYQSFNIDHDDVLPQNKTNRANRKPFLKDFRVEWKMPAEGFESKSLKIRWSN